MPASAAAELTSPRREPSELSLELPRSAHLRQPLLGFAHTQVTPASLNSEGAEIAQSSTRK